MAVSGQELTKENVQSVGQLLRDQYVAKNFAKMARAIHDDAVAKTEERFMKEQHNPGEPSTTPPASNNGKSDVNAQIMAGMGGWQPKPFFKK